MMGGAVAGGGQWHELGNISAAAEANVFNDPEAADMVFRSFADITMAGLNLTHQLDICEVRQHLLERAGEAGRLCHAISEHYVDILKSWGNSHIGLHDPSAVLAVLRPELFETKRVRVDVETKGELTMGQTVADWKGLWGREPQTTLLLGVDVAAAHSLIVNRIARLRFPSLGELRRLEQA
jgi:inosine-uridine nucleoside N-ribohydrolase